MRTTFTILTLLISLISFSQEEETSFITKGSYELTGALSFNSSSQNDIFAENQNSFSIGLLPKLGYAINDNFVLGLGLGFQYSQAERNSNEGSRDFNSTFYSVAPYARKYFSISEQLAFNIQGEVNYSTRNSDSNSFENNSRQWFIGLRPGLSFKLNERFALQAQLGSLGYSHNEFDQNNNEDNDYSNSFGLDINASQFNFGLTYFFK